MKAHEKQNKINLKKLYISVLICFLFMTGEIIGGTISGSLAILTDAAHILSDILGFCISIISLHITQRPASQQMSFGFHRAEIIGALLSISLIWGLTAWLISEAIHRLIHKSSVEGSIMLITASAGLLGNIIMGVVIGHSHSHSHGLGHDHGHNHDHSHDHSHDYSHEDYEHSHRNDHSSKSSEIKIRNSKKSSKISPLNLDRSSLISEDSHMNYNENNRHTTNLNMRAAFLHVLGDALQSVGVIIAGVIIYFRPDFSQADPVCTLIFSIIVMFTTIPIVKDCVKVLMEATPNEINPNDVQRKLSKIEGVIEIHDLHIWSLSAGKLSMSCHLVAEDPHSSLQKATNLLKKDFGILHATIQIELQGEKHNFGCESSIH
ncbi:hypothetical protein SteCoe_10673 [Stentor coeruleus]|uniref:Cation efflux protein cytoplasmic domain-containing protein n=1 Tax=Stentor coeruleus TaxID=5963 RepID=A0A1R2CF46_9CILI|nr:hypothetical protein SteCoe_10673 [Stentor coeruleus]